MTAVACIARRVDALKLNYQVKAGSAVDDEFDERQSLADTAGHAELRLGRFGFLMKRGRSNDRFYFENQDVRCLYDRKPRGRCNLELIPRATFLATHPLASALSLLNEVAEAVGTVSQEHLGRIDLAADFVGFPLHRDDIDNLVTSRARTDGFLVSGKDVEPGGDRLTQHLDAGRSVSGISVAPGNPLMARIYDKTAELKLAGREDKRSIEQQIWSTGGWAPGQQVTRVEGQFRSETLREMKLRCPVDVGARLDGAWQYLVSRWMRLVRPTRKRRVECPLDPRWKAVQAVVFQHPSAPATRTRTRGGATASQALGMVIARQGAIGDLPNAVVGEERAFVASMSSDAQEQWLRSTLDKVFAGQAKDSSRDLILTYGLQEAALRLAIKVNAMRAKYFSVDDLFDDIADPGTAGGDHESQV